MIKFAPREAQAGRRPAEDRLELTIEDHVPYERSILWSLHDGYFASRGGPAWTQSEVPSFATGNYAFARQHAHFITSAVAGLEEQGALAPGGDVWILEVGCGLGDFAASFFRALERGCGEAGRALAPRVRYVLSDYSARTVRDALAREAVGRLAARGSIVPAILDVARPADLLDLDGRRLEPRLAFVIANYLCCVTRPRLLRRTAGGFAEGRIKVTAEVSDLVGALPVEQLRGALLSDPLREGLLAKQLTTDVRWEPADLADLAPDPVHAGTIRELLEPFESATLVYPQAFLDLLRALRERVIPGGLALVSDFGSGTREALGSDQAVTPTYYGNSLNHGVAFAIFDAFGPRAGLHVRRSKDPFSSLFTAALRFGGDEHEKIRRAFRKLYVKSSAGQDLLELRSAALALQERKDYRGAARLLERCLALDPESADLHHRLGSLCLDAGWDTLALRYLRRGGKLDGAREHDFAFRLGRLHMRRGAHRLARRAFSRAVKHAPTALHYMSLGMAHEKLEDYREAYLAFRKSLELDSSSEMARKLMLRVIEQYLPKPWAAGVVEKETAGEEATS